MRVRRLIALVGLLTAVASLAACGNEEPDSGRLRGGDLTVLTVYSSAPLRGQNRALSQSIVAGQRLALKEVGGRVGRFTVRFKSLDDTANADGGWDPRQTADNARLAARDRSTIAYLGDLDSGASAISVPILNEVGILQVSPTNTAVGLTRSGGEKGEPDKYYPAARRTYGRVAPADDLQAEAQVKLQRQRGCRQTYVLDDGDVYGLALGSLFAEYGRRQGLEILGHESALPATERNREIAASVTATAADCLFFAGSATAAAGLFDELHRASPTLRLFAADGLATARFARQLGRGAAARTLLTSFAAPTASYSAAGRRFVANYRKEFGRSPGPLAIYGYESMAITLRAIAEADERGNERRAVIDAFFKLPEQTSALGRYSIDDNGDTSLSAYAVMRVADRRLVADGPAIKVERE